jgi:membrane protein DedA with SNARE-associated domain
MTFQAFLHLIDQWGVAGIFASMALENISFPLPTIGAFLVSQRYILEGRYSFWEMYWLISLAHIFGATLAYWIGYRLSKGLSRRFKDKAGFVSTRKKIEHWYLKYGSVTVLVTRLIGYVRPWSSLVAGFAGFNFWPFLFWSTVGTLIFVYPTMRTVGVLTLIWEKYPSTHLGISIGIILLFSALFIVAALKKTGSKK